MSYTIGHNHTSSSGTNGNGEDTENEYREHTIIKLKVRPGKMLYVQFNKLQDTVRH